MNNHQIRESCNVSGRVSYCASERHETSAEVDNPARGDGPTIQRWAIAWMGGKLFDVSPSNKNGNTWHPSVSETADVTLAREGTGCFQTVRDYSPPSVDNR